MASSPSEPETDELLQIEDDEFDSFSTQPPPASEGSELASSSNLRCCWEGCDGAAGEDLSSAADFSRHMLESHLKGTRDFSCQWIGCPRKGNPLASKFALISHVRKHTGDRPFICPVLECGKSFSRSDALGKHVKTWHPSEAPFVPPLKRRRRQAGKQPRRSTTAKRAPKQTPHAKQPRTIQSVEDILISDNLPMLEKANVLRAYCQSLQEENTNLNRMKTSLDAKLVRTIGEWNVTLNEICQQRRVAYTPKDA